MTNYLQLCNLIEEYRVLSEKDPGRVETVMILMHLQEIRDENTEAEINAMPAMEDTLKQYEIQAGDIQASLSVIDLVDVTWGGLDDPQTKNLCPQ